MRPATADGDSCDHYMVFHVSAKPAAVDGDSMDHFKGFPVTIGLPQYMVMSGAIFWSFLSP